MSKKENKKNKAQEPEPSETGAGTGTKAGAEQVPEPEQTPEAGQTPEAEQAPETEQTPEAGQTPAAEGPKAQELPETDALKASLAEANDKYLRMLAEYDNYRRRSQKERENIYSDVRADTVTKFLPVYDNLARAVQHETDEETRKGVEAIFTQFKGILEGMGVTEIETVGKKFDPALHDALLHIEDEKYGEGEIVMELEKGFKLGDRVIRFARVQVAN